MKSDILRHVTEVRGWIANNVDRQTLQFPSNDAVWEFITTRWPTITTDHAEKLLGEAMKPIPEIEPSPSTRMG